MEFKEKVWKLARRIPRGKVSTYKIVAENLGTKAYRAVGNALNKNRSRQVPCHRIVRSDGSVGGFARGSRKKTMMLKKEGIKIRNEKIGNMKKVLHKF